jgi:type II secretory ATPase GspE/PulE/Tfp pilus assembly ATPase PilB-like protein
MTVYRKELGQMETKYLKDEIQVVYKSCGCSNCKGGYLYRTVIAEVLFIDDEIQSLIDKEHLGDIAPLLRKRGTYKPMIEDIKTLILNGETSLQEAVRVLG